MKKETHHALFNVLLLVSIGLLIFLTIFLVKNVDEIRENPISYGVDKYSFDSCTCNSIERGYITFDKEGVILDNNYQELSFGN